MMYNFGSRHYQKGVAKMKNNIKNLWHGNISPAECCGVNVPEIERLVLLIERKRELLVQELGEQQRDLLQKYTDYYDEYAYLITAQAFSDGFCLACRLLSEAFVSQDGF